MFTCQSDRVSEPSQFVYKSPPIVLVNVGRSLTNTEKNTTAALLVKNLPNVLIIGKKRLVI
jgi:hypothetical protein